jgi:hypothetical protein
MSGRFLDRLVAFNLGGSAAFNDRLIKTILRALLKIRGFEQ